MIRFLINLINDLLDDTRPLANGNVSAHASAMAKEGARQRRESYEAKKARVHAELSAFVRARRAMG